MRVIADSSPLVYLSRVGVLDLLATSFGEVVVPATVWAEVVDARPDAPGVAALRSANWLRSIGGAFPAPTWVWTPERPRQSYSPRRSTLTCSSSTSGPVAR